MHRVGRHADAELCLGEGGLVSRFHALVSWQDGQWVARDLGSRNGTFCGSVALVPGKDHPLSAGDTLMFGGPTEAWTLVDESPPAAWAFDGERRLGAHDGVLVFPDDVHILRLDPRSGWVFVSSEGERLVDDGAVVDVSGHAWTLRLPGGPAPTLAVTASPDVSVLLRVVSEKIEVQLTQRGATCVLRPRAHHQLLLVLARERSRARRRGEPGDEAGWIAIPDLVAHLGITANTAYVWWYRLREQLEAEGVDGGLVERRFTGELRLADVSLTIEEEGRR